MRTVRSIDGSELARSADRQVIQVQRRTVVSTICFVAINPGDILSSMFVSQRENFRTRLGLKICTIMNYPCAIVLQKVNSNDRG